MTQKRNTSLVMDEQLRHSARVEALRQRQTLSEWISDAMAMRLRGADSVETETRQLAQKAVLHVD